VSWIEEQYEEYLKKKNPQQGIILTPADKKPKYRNNRVKVDGLLFDSQFEADYYSHLKLQLKMGTIAGFSQQCSFILQEGFGAMRPITYFADFIVFRLDGTTEIIDTKGMETETFKLKQKMFKAKFPRLELKVVRREDL
jgi:hypothetical protein